VTPFSSDGAPLRIWLRGRSFRDDEVLVDGKLVGIARHPNGPNQWIEVGTVTVAPGEHRLELRRPKRSLSPGDAQKDLIGPFELVADTPPKLVTGAAVRRSCGLPADWIDVVRP
jgi:hypothetical protein